MKNVSFFNFVLDFIEKYTYISTKYLKKNNSGG